MRIIFMGNPAFAIPSLEHILNSSHEILAVVSNPAKLIGRGKKYKETAVGIATKNNKLAILQPPKINDIHFLKYLSWLQPDILVVVAFKILSEKMLSIPKYGAINLHPSKLPKYRGAAPIQWSLINGDTQTAVTTISLTKQIDSGAILMQRSVRIAENDNFGTLSKRLSKLGAELVVETLNNIEKGRIKKIKQAEAKATLAPKVKSKDLKINWQKSAEQIHNRIRAFSPAPGAFTIIDGKRLKIFTSGICKKIIKKRVAGAILNQDNAKLFVSTGNGYLELIEVQLEGKKRMMVANFLRGTNLPNGTIFGK